MAHEDRGCICFACVVGKKPKTPNLSPMADDAITRGGIRGLGSPLYICGAPPPRSALTARPRASIQEKA